jgi:hypothetical protein
VSTRTSGALPQTPGFIAFLPGLIWTGGARFARSPSIPAPESALGVAVGTSITARPPHRSVRAELPHTAPPADTSVETHVRVRM